MSLKERGASSRRGGLEDIENEVGCEHTKCLPIRFNISSVSSSGWVQDADTACDSAGDIPGGGGGLEDAKNESECERARCLPIRFNLGNFSLSSLVLDIDTNRDPCDGVGDIPGGYLSLVVGGA